MTIATAGAASANGSGTTGSAVTGSGITGTADTGSAVTDRGSGSGSGSVSKSGGSFTLRTSDRFAAPRAKGGSAALTYDRRVPVGAEIQVGQRVRPKSMKIEVAVRGAARNRTYGVHVHTRPCGAKPDSSGPHYQHRKDPRQPSVSARYANPRNEVWLDFATDKHGSGSAVARQKWTFRKGEARSVVLHEHATSTHNGKAGQAGDRLACFTVPFESGAPGKGGRPLPGLMPSGESGDLPS
ncbi:superoxide dismutase family protein [Streptomyces albiaxialis]|uniref:superoxide dismutase family protein n=1 Tax=Streptomyces albiaxialis TaxID=329523 RepID=UPI0031DC700F